MTLPPPGWFPDPSSPEAVRWWNGSEWTGHVQRSLTDRTQSSHSPAHATASAVGRPRREQRRAIWILLLVAGVLIATAGAVMASLPIVRGISSDYIFSIPGEDTFQLDAGDYMVYELTGSVSRKGPVTTSRDRTPTAVPSVIQVRDSSGQSLEVRPHLSSTTYTVNRGNDTYTGIARFTVRVSGAYTVQVPQADAGEAIVARTFGDLVRQFLPWALFGLLGLILALVGSGMLIAGYVRRRRAHSATQGDASSLAQPW